MRRIDEPGGRQGWVLDTGRYIRVNQGMLSLSDDGELYEGYDGHITVAGEVVDDVGRRGPLTTAERQEIATAMIDRWHRWAGGRFAVVHRDGSVTRD